MNPASSLARKATHLAISSDLPRRPTGIYHLEKMKLDEKGFPQPTGEFETLEADSVVLALGQDVDLSLLKGVAGLTPGQVQSANAWNDALYDAGLLSSLGLETNHNEKLEEQLKKEKVRQPPCT